MEVPEVVERVLIRRRVLDGVRANIAGDFVAPGLGLDLVDARIAAAPVIFVKVEVREASSVSELLSLVSVVFCTVQESVKLLRATLYRLTLVR